jgi:hypothetical protein
VLGLVDGLVDGLVLGDVLGLGDGGSVGQLAFSKK